MLLSPADNAKFMALADISADMLKKLGINVDYQSLDWATVTQRRVRQEPVTQGGWSMVHSASSGADQLNPGVHSFLSGAGAKGVSGWPSSARIEELRNEWFAAADVPAQKKVAADLQLQAFQDVPYVPLGQWFNPTAHRTNLHGMLTGLPLFWNIQRG